jgi:hypothetical protein
MVIHGCLFPSGQKALLALLELKASKGLLVQKVQSVLLDQPVLQALLVLLVLLGQSVLRAALV